MKVKEKNYHYSYTVPIENPKSTIRKDEFIKAEGCKISNNQLHFYIPAMKLENKF